MNKLLTCIIVLSFSCSQKPEVANTNNKTSISKAIEYVDTINVEVNAQEIIFLDGQRMDNLDSFRTDFQRVIIENNYDSLKAPVFFRVNRKARAGIVIDIKQVIRENGLHKLIFQITGNRKKLQT